MGIESNGAFLSSVGGNGGIYKSIIFFKKQIDNFYLLGKGGEG